VQQHIDQRSLGVFGEARVNVLRLNLALQRAYPGH
jgi:K+-transporting ATPase c subunit